MVILDESSVKSLGSGSTRSCLEHYVVPALRLNMFMRSTFPTGVVGPVTKGIAEALFSNKPGWSDSVDTPVSMRKLAKHLRADVALLTIPVLRQAASEEDSAVLKELHEESISLSWTQLIRRLYANVPNDGSPCLPCLETAAQLMYAVDDSEAAISDLHSGADSAALSNRTRLLHLAAKYRAATLLKPDLNRKSKVLADLDRLQDAGAFVLAQFERARFLHAWGDPPERATVLGLLKAVLKRRPKHAFTRYLLAKEFLRMSPPPEETISILWNLLTDIIDSKGAFVDELNSLGDGDFVHYSVDPTYVFEDLFDLLMERCDEPFLIGAVDFA